MGKCSYCDNILHSSSINKKNYNTIIIETDNFVVVPTLGMIIPGWLLLITKKHILNMSFIPSDWYLEIEYLISRTTNLISSNFSFPVLFEHGPDNTDLSNTGACIDHAHFHFIPSNKNIKPELQKKNKFSKIKTFNDLKVKRKEFGSYLFFQDQNGEKYISGAKEIPSQYIRKVVATLYGKNYEWDWKTFSHKDNIEKTLKIFNANQ